MCAAGQAAMGWFAGDSVPQGVQRHAPQALALIEPGGQSNTFGDLQSRMRAIARAVRESGISKDDVVALILPDGADLIASFLGVCAAAPCAILNPNLTAGEMQSVLRGIGARAMIADPACMAFTNEFAGGCGVKNLKIDGRMAVEEWAAPGPEEVALVLQTSGT